MLRLAPAERAVACRTLDELEEWASELGLTGSLGALACDELAWPSASGERERSAFHSLLERARGRASSSHAESYLGKIRTMLHWVALFVERFPGRALFLPLYDPATHTAHARHNDETLAAFQMFMHEHGALRGSVRGAAAGAVLAPASIAAVASTLRAYRSSQAQYNIRVESAEYLQRGLQRSLRREAGPAGGREDRALTLGFGTAELERVLATGWRPVSERDVLRWALAHVLIQVVGRGGEPGIVEGRSPDSFDPRRGVVIADVRWLDPHAAGGVFHVADVWWYPIKDANQVYKKVPQRISRTHRRVETSWMDPYDSLRQWWVARSAQVACASWAATPLFAFQGRVVDTAFVRTSYREFAQLIGDNPADYGAKSGRVAGATRIYEEFGQVVADRILADRGRWWSDCKWIYARLSARMQGEVSRRMAQVGGPDMERSAGWVQPARRAR